MQNILKKFIYQILSIIALIAAIAGCAVQSKLRFTSLQPVMPQNISLPSTINILVDDFVPQPYQGSSIYFFNRLEGDRGAVNDMILDWGMGQVTMTIPPGKPWGGIWMSLNHPIREGLPINFSAILPAQITSEYQSRITGLQKIGRASCRERV